MLRESQDCLLGASLQSGGDVCELRKVGRLIAGASRSEERLQARHIAGAKPRQSRIDHKQCPARPARSALMTDNTEEPIDSLAKNSGSP